MSTAKELIAKEIADVVYEKAVETSLRDLGQDSSRMSSRIAELVAARWVDENFSDLAKRIDMDAIVKMVQLRAVGKAMGER